MPIPEVPPSPPTVGTTAENAKPIEPIIGTQEYQPPGEQAALTLAPGNPPFKARSGSNKYVATCSCGARFDMDSLDANRILVDRRAYDELAMVTKMAHAHEADTQGLDYDGPTPPPVHPGHTMRWHITLPAKVPPATTAV